MLPNPAPVCHVQLDVKEAKRVEDHPQWDISDTEDEADPNKHDDNDSDYSTDMDDDDDEYDDWALTGITWDHVMAATMTTIVTTRSCSQQMF